MLHDRQVLDGLVGRALDRAVELGGDRLLALAVEALDLGGAGLEIDVGHGVEGGQAAAGHRHPQGLDLLQVGAALGRQADADRDAALAHGELGHVGVDIAQRRHPGHLGDRVHRDAQAGGVGGTRADHHLGPDRRHRGFRIGDQRDGAHLLLELEGGAL